MTSPQGHCLPTLGTVTVFPVGERVRFESHHGRPVPQVVELRRTDMAAVLRSLVADTSRASLGEDPTVTYQRYPRSLGCVADPTPFVCSHDVNSYSPLPLFRILVRGIFQAAFSTEFGALNNCLARNPRYKRTANLHPFYRWYYFCAICYNLCNIL